MNTITKEISQAIARLREAAPLVHNITNYVTVNDCANALLAIGASPIMADDLAESGEITAISSALVLNIGTLNRHTVDSMLAAGKRANECGVPVVFDPVGAGASKLRNDTVKTILEQVKITILRGNISEVSFVAGLDAATKGVDASAVDGRRDAVSVAGLAAERLGCTVAITGAVDVISDGKRVVKIHNGHPMLSKVTGTGCMTSALAGAYAGANKDAFVAAAAGVASMGIAGEIAYEKAGHLGTGGFHIAVIDALSRLDSAVMEARGKLDEA
ncbi:MAG: hydroxyethylthiazole kinase [Clostridiales bacterium]|nr:hydroxyethylthiazole kinase [Clostridiales bacterium]